MMEVINAFLNIMENDLEIIYSYLSENYWVSNEELVSFNDI